MTTHETAWVIGATSSLGTALCRILGERGFNLILTGRSEDTLRDLQEDLQIRYDVTVGVAPVNFLDGGFDPQTCVDELGDFDHAFMLAGDMGSGDARDLANLRQVMEVNFTVPALLLSAIANRLEARGKGCITVVSSVAGDRGRQSNYPYGSAKAGLTSFASGLRNRLHASGVHVMTVKPGFIDTPMTYGMKSPLIASRESVAEAIANGFASRKNCMYVPGFWRLIMFIIRMIPEPVFKRLKL